MRKSALLIYFICLTACFTLFATVPQAFKYQAVVRDNAGNVLPNRNVTIRLSILKSSASGIAVYAETHSVTTSSLGLINIEIGTGTPVSGSMQNIDWGSDQYFIKIEMDQAGGSNYTLIGTSQLVSVPYALYANKAANGTQWKDTSNNIYFNTGKVAIGTNAPVSTFEVRDNANRGGRMTITGNLPSIRLTDTAYSGNGVIVGVAADSNDLLNRSGKGDLVFSNEAYGTGGGYLFGTGVPDATCVKIANDCKVGIGTDQPVSKLDVKGGDVNIEDIGSGVIMKSPDGNCWRLTVSNTGQPVFTSIQCLNYSSIQNNCLDAVACYSFNGNANDVSGNGFNGTIHGATLSTDRKGNANSAYYFRGNIPGNADYIELPTLASINNTEEISISLWVKADNSVGPGSTPFTMIPDDPSDRLNAHFNYSPNSVYWDYGDIFGSGRVSVNQENSYVWDHYVFVKSAVNNKMQVYKNGVSILDENKHDDITNKNKNIRLGGGSGNNADQYFTGWMDDVKIFKRALTATEVLNIYNSEK